MSTVRSMKLENDVRILESEMVYNGFFKIKKWRLQFRLFEGGWSHPIYRELIMRRPAVSVLPYDPHLKKVVLIEQFRIGSMEDVSSPWQLELIAGLVESGESLEEVALRESGEEANLVLDNLVPVHQYWSSPGGSNESMSIFCSHIDASTIEETIAGLVEEGENIRVAVFDVEQAFDWVRSGLINNAPAIIALQWLELKCLTNP